MCQVVTFKLFRQVIAGASGRPAAWLVMVALSLTSLASASQEKPFDFDEISLPTDLVATVVSVEDDIVLSYLADGNDPTSLAEKYSSNTKSSGAATKILETDVAGSVTEQRAEQPSENQNISAPEESASGSIFDNVVDSPELVAVQESESESEVELAAADQQPEADSGGATDTPSSTPEPEVEAEVAAAEQDAPAVDPEPVPELASAAPVAAVTEQEELAINEDEIILGWATAWSNNDIEDYLDYYAADFEPSEDGVDFEAWKAQRRERLQNQEIRIVVSNAELYEVRGDQAEVRFTQRYTSKSYKDRVIKSITMKQTPAGWKFLSERTVEKLTFE